jgi:hypothetical protein
MKPLHSGRRATRQEDDNDLLLQLRKQLDTTLAAYHADEQRLEQIELQKLAAHDPGEPE